MHLGSSRRRLAGLTFAAAVVAATFTAVPAASAAPVFDDAESYVYGSNYTNDYSAECNIVDETNSPTDSVPLVENGPPVTYSQSASATHSDGGSDTATVATQVTATASIKSAAGLPIMDFSASGSNQATFAQNPSNCYPETGSYVNAYAKFTLTQPGFMELTTKGTGKGFDGEIEVYSDSDSSTDMYLSGSGSRFTGTAEVFLEPGTYWLYAAGGSYVSGSTSRSYSGSISVHAEFHVAGSQSAAPDGKGKRYVNFPASRNCAAHTLTPTITEKGKRAEKIQSVKFFVNDKLVKKVRNPSKGLAVAVPIADNVDADVLAKVKLEKVKKGVPAKRHEVTTSYIACS